MAAPHVAAACALAWSRDPGATYHQIIQRVLAGVDPLPALAGKCRTGGRLNLKKVLSAQASVSAPVLYVQGVTGGQFYFRVQGTPFSSIELQASTNLRSWTSTTTNQLPASGVLNYFDNTGTASEKFYRAVLRP